MGYEDLLAEALRLGVKVRERELSPGRCGCYYEPTRLIIIDETLPRLRPTLHARPRACSR